MTEAEQETDSGLNALDWLVIVCGTIVLILLTIWIYRGRKTPPAPEG